MKRHKQKLLLVIFFSIGLFVIGMNMNLACGLGNNQMIYLDGDPNEPEPGPEIVFMTDDPNEPEPGPEFTACCLGLTFMDDDPNEPEPDPEIAFMEDDPNEPEPDPEYI